MIDLRAVRRYSRAIFELGEKSGQLDSLDNQLLAARKIVEKYPEIGRLVSNSTIAFSEKEDFIGKIFPADLSPLVINFLKVLIRKKRFLGLSAIQEDFHRLYEKKRRVEEVTVISAVPLSEQNAAKLKSVLNKKLNSDINLIQQVNPHMIGGLILRFAGNEINASFRARLESLHQLLAA